MVSTQNVFSELVNLVVAQLQPVSILYHFNASLSPPPLVVIAWCMYDNSEWLLFIFPQMMWLANIPHIPVTV